MQELDTGDGQNDLDLSVFVDMQPDTICTLVECGEFNRKQFLSLMKLCNEKIVRSVIQTINDTTLQAFLMEPEDFQPFFEVIVVALGEEELRARAKQWLIKASKEKAKSDAIQCSKIIQAIVLHQANTSAARQLGPSTRPITTSLSIQTPSFENPIKRPPLSHNTSQPKPGQKLAPQIDSQHSPATLTQALMSPIPRLEEANGHPTEEAPVPPAIRSTPSLPQSLPQSPPARTPFIPRAPQPFPLDMGRAPIPPSPLSPKDPLPFPSSPTRHQHRPLFTSPAPQARNPRDQPPDLLALHTTSPRTLPAATTPPTNDLPATAEPKKPGDEGETDADMEEATNQDAVTNTSSANPWDAATNAEKVKKWNLEEAIQTNPRHTSPFRTQWMYEDRKKAMNVNDEEYKALTDQEYSKLTRVPPALRCHAGLVYNKKSKFDWEVRVVLGRLAYDYSQMDEPENGKFLRDALGDIEARFPDISPAHIFRKIDKEGAKAVEKWWSDVLKWVQTTAGKMSSTNNELEHHVEMLDVKKSSKKFDAHKLLGLKRADVNYVLWGQTDAGVEKCEPLIQKEMDKWKAMPENQAEIEKDPKVYGQHRLKVEARIRKEKFGLLPEEEQDEYSRKSKNGISLSTEEEIWAAAESLLSHLTHVSGQAAGVGDLHVVLMASGVISGGRIPVIIKEFGVKPDQGPFLNEQNAGGRAKAEYPAYVSTRFKADPVELQILDKGLDDIQSGAGQGSKPGKGKGKGKASTLEGSSAKPQPSNTLAEATDASHQTAQRSIDLWKPPATVTTDRKRADYLSRFLGSTYKNNFAGQLSWNAISVNNDRFIEPQRRPSDTDGSPILLMNPQAMPVGTHLAPWWEFMQRCAVGQVASDKVFAWKAERIRLAVPSIPAPANQDIHMSGLLSQTAKPTKRPRGSTNTARKSRKSRGKTKPRSGDPDMDLEEDMEGLLEEAEQYLGLEPESSSSRNLRNRPSFTTPAGLDNNDDEESASSGSEFGPEPDVPQRPVQRARPNPLRITSPKPTTTNQLALEEGSPPPLYDGPLDQASPPASPEAAAQPALQLTADIPTTSSKPPSTASKRPFAESSLADPSQNTAHSTLRLPADIPTTSFEPHSTASKSPFIATSPIDPSPNAPAKSAATSKVAPGKTSSGRSPPPIQAMPFTELRLGYPRVLSGDAIAAGSPAWLQVKPLLAVWGSKISFLNISQCDILLNSASPKPDVSLPSALTSAISIMQVYLALQLPDPRTPEPLVRISPACNLDDVHPHHHLRQVIEGILDVQAPLPSSKVFECNMLLTADAIHAFFATLEDALSSFIDTLTADEDTLRYAEVEFFTALWLALYVKETTFMRDEGSRGSSAERVGLLLDRFVSVLAGVAVLRYMQEFLGGTVTRWCREEPDKCSENWAMWFSVSELWKAGMTGLASSLNGKRNDLFQYRGINDVLPAAVKSIVDVLMVKPAWWSPPGDGIPIPFTIGLKQFVPSDQLFNQLPNIPWSRLSFLDRTSILLIIFICAMQLAQEPKTSPRLKTPRTDEDESLITLFSTRCRELRGIIEGAVGTEDGPKYIQDMSLEESHRRRMVQAWVKVWEQERGPDATTAAPASTTGPVAPPQEQNRARIEVPIASQVSSIVPATPSVLEDDLEDSGPAEGGKVASANTGGLPTIAEEVESKKLEVEDPEEDDGVDATVLVPRTEPNKRKVIVGGRRVADPTVGAAENPRRRLRSAAAVAASTPEELPEEQPRRKARINNVSSTPASRRQEAAHPATATEVGSSCSKKSSSKKPKAVVAKAQAAASSSAPSSSPQKLTKKQKRVEAAKKAAAAKAQKKKAAT